jgi:hypothetical protein
MRMSKGTHNGLAQHLKPFFRRLRSLRGSRPVPFVYALLYTIRALAQGLKLVKSIDQDVGESTIEKWIPATCGVFARSLPIPPRTHVNDAAAWGARFKTFRELKRRRICKNKASSQGWRRSLPIDVEFLGNIAEVFDGMVTPLAEASRTLSPGDGPIEGRTKQEFFCPRYATHALNNMFGVDGQGTITTAGFGWPRSVSDLTMIHENPFRVAMEELDTANVPNQDRAPDCLSCHVAVNGDSGFALRFFCLTPSRQADTKRGSNFRRRAVYNFLL